MINTQNIFVRLALAVGFILLAPFGGFVLFGAFDESQPHIFVMMIFSGCLSLLLGLVCLIGFLFSFFKRAASSSSDAS